MEWISARSWSASSNRFREPSASHGLRRSRTRWAKRKVIRFGSRRSKTPGDGVHGMKFAFRIFGLCWLLSLAVWAQSDAAGLDHVLTQMDTAARSFRTTEASVVWDQYQKVIDDKD